MGRQAGRKDLSLKWLELFQTCARKGSLQAGAEEAGISVSTASHHIRSLEDHLGVELFNHTKRPMVLTAKGQMFLRNIDEAMLSIRKAIAEASAGNTSDASYLRVGAIEDLDSDIIPELAVHLSTQMPKCDFSYLTDDSRDIIDMLRNRQLDIGIVTDPGERLGDLLDRPLLRDPFVMVVPQGCKLSSEDLVTANASLPYLRFSNNLIIGRQVESQLRRMGMSLRHRFESSSNHTLMAMVGSGAGWAVTTPLLFWRVKRLQPKLEMRRFPGKRFARNVAIVSTPDCSLAVRDLVDGSLRRMISEQAIEPLHQQMPWLKGNFELTS